MLKGLYVDQVVPSQSWVGTVVHGFGPTADQHCVFGHLWTFWSQVIDSFMRDEKKQRTNLSIVKFATGIAKAILLREAVILTNTLSIPF